MATWPVTLPPRFVEDGYAESPPDTTIRTSMDAGVDKVRRRYTAGPRPISGVLMLTLAEVDILDAFYVTTLQSGALRFDWQHPRKLGTVAAELRFMKPPSYEVLAPDCWRASLQLEVMP